MISGAAAAVVGVIASIVLGLAGLAVQLRTAKREQRAREAEAKRLHDADMAAAYGKGYAEGDRDARADLGGTVRVVTSERDAARDRCAWLQQEHADCARQREALEAEIRRMQRGGKP